MGSQAFGDEEDAEADEQHGDRDEAAGGPPEPVRQEERVAHLLHVGGHLAVGGVGILGEEIVTAAEDTQRELHGEEDDGDLTDPRRRAQGDAEADGDGGADEDEAEDCQHQTRISAMSKSTPKTARPTRAPRVLRPTMKPTPPMSAGPTRPPAEMKARSKALEAAEAVGDAAAVGEHLEALEAAADEHRGDAVAELVHEGREVQQRAADDIAVGDDMVEQDGGR
ncbi:MAG: hypothetical protein R3F65_31030 [bacterium]